MTANGFSEPDDADLVADGVVALAAVVAADGSADGSAGRAACGERWSDEHRKDGEASHQDDDGSPC